MCVILSTPLCWPCSHCTVCQFTPIYEKYENILLLCVKCVTAVRARSTRVCSSVSEPQWEHLCMATHGRREMHVLVYCIILYSIVLCCAHPSPTSLPPCLSSALYKDGNTAIMIASFGGNLVSTRFSSYEGHIDCVKLLLKADSDVGIQNKVSMR